MKNKISIIVIMLVFIQQLIAQPSSYFYAGVNGGYVFTPAKVLENKTWHLKDGYFGELNLGYRKNQWGFSLNPGYLTLKRDASKFSNIAINKRMMYDSVTSGLTPPNLVDGFDVPPTQLNFDKTTHTQFIHKNLQSLYALAGVDYNFGKKKIQIQVHAVAGAGAAKLGYYFVEGNARKITEQTLFTSASNDLYQVTADVHYYQLGMSEKTYNQAVSSSTGQVNEKYSVLPMARAGVNADYRLSQRISVFAGASAWYIHTPPMKGMHVASGEHSYQSVSTLGPLFNGAFSYQQPFSNVPLWFYSANAGVKFNFIRNAKAGNTITKEPVTTTSTTASIQPKDLLIVVKDLQTGQALSGVQVSITRNGSFYTTAITNQNGQIEKITAASPGNYEIKGTKNNIAATGATITETEFQGSAAVIYKELTHNDPRFTLLGTTVERKNDNKLAGIQTILTHAQTADVFNQISDTEGKFIYQLQPNSDYTVVANQKGYFSNIEKVTTKGLDRSKTIYATLVLGIDELKEGNQFEIKDIYYDLDKDNIRQDAAVILNRLVTIMQQNPELEIELSSHTDSRGSAVYNQALSQRRAQSAVNYLISKGIKASRLNAKGYGESRLLNRCDDNTTCSEAEHQQNRRTEIKVLKN